MGDTSQPDEGPIIATEVLVNPDFGQYAGGKDEPAAPIPPGAVHGSEGVPGEFGYGVTADEITYTPPPRRVLRPEDGIASDKVSGQG